MKQTIFIYKTSDHCRHATGQPTPGTDWSVMSVAIGNIMTFFNIKDSKKIAPEIC